VSIRFKVILPYLLLTLIVAVTGVYVVTRLVAGSLNERLTNQLLEAGRVVSDGMARQEIQHVEAARIVAFTRGLDEALLDGDRQTINDLAKPIASGLGIENLILVDTGGWEMIHLIRSEDGRLEGVSGATGAGNTPLVQPLLEGGDPDALPRRALGLNPADGRYYYFTSIPIPHGEGIAGVVVVGTSLDSLLPYLKSTSLADVIVYGDDGQAIATTLGSLAMDPEAVQSLSIPQEQYLQIIQATDLVTGKNFTVEGRSYSLARGALRVSSDRLGGFAVVLPSNFVLQAGALSRNTYVGIFTLAMVSVIIIGFLIARMIITPLSSLVNTSRAIAGGDLAQRTGLKSKDEIGTLANTFDEMTQTLQQRTVDLERTNQLLEQMDHTKSNFITISAHELRTPLTLIQGYSQMLQQKAKINPELESMADGILDGTTRMAEIINNMLDITKIDSQTLNVAPSELQIDQVIEKAYRSFKEALIERDLTFKTIDLDQLPVVAADPELLYKAFHHLIMNAIKYTPDGGEITVSGRALAGKSEVEVAVKDTGIGIAPELKDVVFEKFYQTGEVLLHSSGKTKFKGGGPGLGLAIARGVVEAHKGSIWLESPGRDEKEFPGTTFFVRLPISGNGRVK
jgi:signal transduction histidine kinase